MAEVKQPRLFEDKKRYKKRVSGKCVAIGVMAGVLIIFALLKLSVEICEWYSRNISSALIKAANTLTGWLPFSVFEVLIYLAAALTISFLIFIIVALCRKQFKRAFNSLVDLALVVFIVGTVYGAFAILPYNRKEADIPLYQGTTELDEEAVYAMAEEYIDALNALSRSVERNKNGELIIPGGLEGLNESLQNTYEEVLTSDYFYDTDSHLKKWLWPELMSAFSISGVFFAPTAECNVCTAYYTTSVVAAAAHEMAHSKGAVREADANLVSYYIMLNSSDYLVRYVGYYTLVSDMLDLIVGVNLDPEGREELMGKLSDEYFADARFAAQYAEKQGALGGVGSFFNDLYLKLSGLEDGTDNYSPQDEGDMVEISPGENGEAQTVLRITAFNDVKKMLVEMFYQK